MNFHFPDRRALCMAENATHNLHNLLTLRGALVRDPRIWSRYLDEAIELFGSESDVAFASHHWPTWGHRPHRHVPVSAARPLRLPARSDAADAQPGRDRHRDRRGFPAAARARRRLARPRLLRLGQPQRQGDLPALPGLVRRSPVLALGSTHRRPPRPATRRRSAGSTPSSTRAVASRPTVTCASPPNCSSMPCSPTRTTLTPRLRSPTSTDSWVTARRTRPGEVSTSPGPRNSARARSTPPAIDLGAGMACRADRSSSSSTPWPSASTGPRAASDSFVDRLDVHRPRAR